MTIREYEDSTDRETVIRLWETVFDGHVSGHNDPAASIDRKKAINDNLFYVAVDASGAVIGTTMAGYDGHRGWLYSVAVAQDKRHKGIGRALIMHTLRELKKRGCPKVNLQVRGNNHQAIGFYEKMGFSRDDCISMGLKDF